MIYLTKNSFYDNSSFVNNKKRERKAHTTDIQMKKIHAHKLRLREERIQHYKVEYIASISYFNKKKHFLVKWKTWSVEFSAWVPFDEIRELNCASQIDIIEKEYMQTFRPDEYKSYESKYSQNKKKQRKQLMKDQQNLNKITKGRPFIALENEVDLDTIPMLVKNYIVKNVAVHPIKIKKEPITHCVCKGRCSKSKNCCPFTMSQTTMPYKNDLIQQKKEHLIFECNDSCACDINCKNRVTQKGSNCKLMIYKTADKGWGVKALERIEKGAFISEYNGEVLTERLSDSRRSKNSESHFYTFELTKKDEKENRKVLDATHKGNIAKFINHSCNPNVVQYGGFTTLNTSQVFYFANKEIEVNDELTVDYYLSQKKVEQGDQNVIRCLCGEDNCRTWIKN